MGDFSSSISSAEMGFGQLEALVARLKEGDEQAFAEVFQLYRDMVYTLCCKLLTEKAEAMDVTQEVFLTLFRKVRKFRGDCTLKTWLYRVTLNHAANRNRWWRRRLRHRTHSLTLNIGDSETTINPHCPRPSPHRKVLSEELSRAIHSGLRELPFDQRAAIILRDVQGLTYEEIAEVTGVQIGTVKSRLARGRERLRRVLAHYRPHSEKNR